MTVAFIFNAGEYSSFYGDDIKEVIFSTGILQNCSRSMKIRIGDILFNSYSNASRKKYIQLANDTFYQNKTGLYATKLDELYTKINFYTWVIENIHMPATKSLHKALLNSKGYLGSVEVDFNFSTHIVFFRKTLILRYRVLGNLISTFYDMGNDEDSTWEHQELLALGFSEAKSEDMGLANTIFDQFSNSPNYFKKYKDSSKLLEIIFSDSDFSSEIISEFEDVNPYFIYALGSISRSYILATDNEDYSQVAFTIRRLIEKTADSLFPARKECFEGMKVTQSNHKNRLLAYISTALPISDTERDNKWEELRSRIDFLLEEYNTGIHDSISADNTKDLIKEGIKLIFDILMINPSKSRFTLYPYEESLDCFLKEVIKEN